jgi:hypothetical protein
MSDRKPSPRHELALPPGPPDFSEFEGQLTHHPGASGVPGAGPNPTPLDVDETVDADATTPAASSPPGAGPNPTPLPPDRSRGDEAPG